MAISEFYAAERPTYAKYEELTLPYYLILSGNKEKAELQLDKNSTDSFFFSSPKHIAAYFQNRALTEIYKHNFEKVAAWYDSCLKNAPDAMSSSHYSRAALNQINLNNPGKALMFLHCAEQKAKDSDDSLYFKLAKSKLNALNGKYQDAFLIQDSIYTIPVG